MVAEQSLYRSVLRDRQDLYNRTIDNGRYTPFIYPWDTIPAALLLVGVVLTPKLPSRVQFPSRVLLTVLSTWYCWTRWASVRTIGMAGGYGVGLAAVWGLIMTVVLLLLHDPAKDFRRLEVREDAPKDSSHESNGSISTATRNDSVDARQRKVHGMNSSLPIPEKPTNDAVTRPYRLVWQGYPTACLHLLDWTFDLLTSFRGINWNFRIPTVPKLDAPYLDEQAYDEKPTRSIRSDLTSIPASSAQQLKRQAIYETVFWYLYIDLFKTFMTTDPYFLGITALDSPTPWTWLAEVNHHIPIATRAVRLSISMGAVISALTLIFSLAPLFFAVILPAVLGEKLSSITKSPLREPGMYPPQWGPMWQTISTKGLGGFWGSWWHQMFRYGISEPSEIFLRVFGIDRKSTVGRTIQLLTAFSLTGLLHGVAASTTFSIVPSKPLDPFIFFVLQAFGILLQTTLAAWVRKVVTVPRYVRKFTNMMFVVIWAWYTGPLLADDFARCNIWLFEPNPISIFRGLGFGPGDTWIPWLEYPAGARWVGLWNSDKWYTRGIAIY